MDGNYVDNGFGNGGLWLFAILALMWGGNGFFGNKNGGCATTEDVNNSANFTRLESQVQNNGNRTETKSDQIINGLSSVGYEMAQQFNATNNNVNNGFCNLEKTIMENRYLSAQNTASINANIKDSSQKILDQMAQDKIATLQAEVNNLKMQQMFCGVVRYPTQATYALPYNPVCGCGGNNNNI